MYLKFSTSSSHRHTQLTEPCPTKNWDPHLRDILRALRRSYSETFLKTSSNYLSATKFDPATKDGFDEWFVFESITDRKECKAKEDFACRGFAVHPDTKKVERYWGSLFDCHVFASAVDEGPSLDSSASDEPRSLNQ